MDFPKEIDALPVNIQMPAPLSAEQIQAARTGRRAQVLEWLSRNAEYLVLAGILGVPGSLGLAALAVWIAPDLGALAFHGGLLVGAVIAAVGMASLWIDPLAPANRVQTEAILAIAPTLPGGEAFLAEVAAQKRVFTQREWRQAIEGKQRLLALKERKRA